MDGLVKVNGWVYYWSWRRLRRVWNSARRLQSHSRHEAKMGHRMSVAGVA